MSKKIRFPLQMNGTDVRTIEELREHFDLESVLGYFANGKLITWLRDHYYDNEAMAVEALQPNDAELNQRLMDILGINVSDDVESVDFKQVQRRMEKIALLRQLTDDEDLIAKVDAIAFNQEDLEDIQKNGAKEIYLCKGHFSVSMNQTDFVYNSLFNPTITIREENAENNESISILMNETTIHGGEDFQYQMGLRFYQGDGVEKDYKRAFELFSKSAAKGNIEALVQQGICYYYGRGVPLNYAQAVDCFKKGIKAENKEAYFWLGKCYFYHYGGYTTNHRYIDFGLTNYLAAFCFLKSYNNEIVKWYLYKIGAVFTGVGVRLVGRGAMEIRAAVPKVILDKISEKDERLIAEAKKIDIEKTLMDLIKSGDTDAEFEMGKIFIFGNKDFGITQNQEKGKNFINHSAQNNQVCAQQWLGSQGGSDFKYYQVKEWLTKEEQRSWSIQSYLNGSIAVAASKGLCADEELIVRSPCNVWCPSDEWMHPLLNWYIELANNGNPYAQYCLAEYYVEISDISEAQKWILKAAENNLAQAQYELGNSYIHDFPFKPKKHYPDSAFTSEFNCEKGIFWLTKSAEQGHMRAANLLGRIYNGSYSGDKVIASYDRNKAVKYLTIAAKFGETISSGILCDKYGINISPINRLKVHFKEQLNIDLESITID